MRSADEFLNHKELFQLGVLPTEQSHPKTRGLSEWSQGDLKAAIAAIQNVDIAALRSALTHETQLRHMHRQIKETLSQGGRVFICGCGATGRLALSLEYLFRASFANSADVVSFMAGGDVALVHSLEGFEDYPAYGARHLMELGFQENDLLISSSEGGETPYVIGATEEAARHSRRPPFFLFCNPQDILLRHVERSRRVFENPRIQSIELATGPMALAGSTRMQASTVLMFFIGLSLLHHDQDELDLESVRHWIDFYEQMDLAPLQSFIRREAETYLESHKTIYAATDMAMTVFTDTTERAPTFNLAPFDNHLVAQMQSSLTYVMIPGTRDVESSWEALLHRAPRALNWPEIHPKATPDYLRGFDFSQKVVAFRTELIPVSEHRLFEVLREDGQLVLRFMGMEERFRLFDDLLLDHLIAKMILNIHSTLVMGRLGRYQENIMTWVFPSNGKLVDRATRYALQILETRGVKGDYDQLVRILFEVKPSLSPTESIVLKMVDTYVKRTGG